MNRFMSRFRSFELRPLSSRLYSSYQTSGDRSLRTKQVKQFPKLTQQVYVQTQEVPTYDGQKIVEPLLDPNQVPHELHLIKKTGKLLGEPWWVKEAMKKLGFKTYMTKEWDVVHSIRPNTPEINKLLWHCKHVVKVVPIKFTNGYPSDSDLGNTKLNLETGEFEIIKKLDVINGVKVTTSLSQSSSFPLNKKDLLDQVHRQKQLGLLNDEYFPADYNYKYDQDKHGVIRLKGRPNTDIMEDDVTDEPPQ